MTSLYNAANITATTTATQLSALLTTAGVDIGSAVTSSAGYFRNLDASINLQIGTGATAPTDFVTIPAGYVADFLAGMNTNEVWLKSASSTVSVDFVEGGTIQATKIDGVIGTITLTDDTIPKGDSSNLVNSSIVDDGSTVAISEPVTSTGYIKSLGTTGIGYGTGAGGAGSFRITLANASGTTTEQPVFNFAVIKGVTS